MILTKRSRGKKAKEAVKAKEADEELSTDLGQFKVEMETM